MKYFLLLLLLPIQVYALQVNATVEPRISDRVLWQVNEYRVSKGLPMVSKWDHLCNFAKIRSKQVPTDWSHDQFFTVMNTDPFNRYRGRYWENLAYGYKENSVVGAWKKSPSHNKMMLSTIDYACVANNGIYYVLIGYDAY